MIKNLWNKYENYILKYSNTQLRSWYALLISLIPFLLLNYIVFYFILSYNVSYNHFVLISLSIPMGRLLYMYIIYKNDLYFENGHNWFTLLLFIFGMFIAMSGLIYLIIKDINGGFKNNQQKTKSNIEFKIDKNLLDNNNKYDYLLQNNK